jgi:ATP-dependent Lon protease
MSNLPDFFADTGDFEPPTPHIIMPDGTFEAAVLALRDLVLFPHIVHPLYIGRSASLKAMAHAREENHSLIAVLQKNAEVTVPDATGLHSIGVELMLGRSLFIPDGTTSVLVKGMRRVAIEEILHTSPYIKARVKPLTETHTPSMEVRALRRVTLDLFENIVSMTRSLPEEAYIFALNIEDPGHLADFLVHVIDFDTDDKQEVLELSNALERLKLVSLMLGDELNLLELEETIHAEVLQRIDRQQNEIFLREQMRAIQDQLGEKDAVAYRKQQLQMDVVARDVPQEVEDYAFREIERLVAMPPSAHEANVIRTFIDVLVDLPWREETQDTLDTQKVAAVLDADHYGLQKAKDRVLEHIAVRKLAPENKRSPIICFVGPPGTGKTSLGRSIARALGRRFVRMSLGGVRDESAIRGHRRTYVGALPGRIIQGMRRAGTVNPLFMLDEIDKLGSDFRGDPSSALLEVLDPEQNFAFNDHYLEVDYDLSKVMFITTANTTSSIPPALRDRLEFIEFPGYIQEEKVQIARKYLIPKAIRDSGLSDHRLRFDTTAIETLIRDYTYEAGVRNLEREIANITRKVARKVVEGDENAPKRITTNTVRRLLGPDHAPHPILIEEPEVGIMQGVAWTEAGGEVFPVEVTLMPGKGNFTLTGQLGDIMQESAQAAFSYMRAFTGISADQLEEVDVHVHLPENAIPKDGPSAGVTLAAALISAFTERPARHDIAMTGEITLRGRVLPVGGIKEKLLAAHRLGTIHTVLIPADNEKNIDELPEEARKALTIIPVSRMEEVITHALLADEG